MHNAFQYIEKHRLLHHGTRFRLNELTAGCQFTERSVFSELSSALAVLAIKYLPKIIII